MISYAQNCEDVILARVFAGMETGFYVDVGAWDPEIDSVTKHFYDIGWRGVNIEPHPIFYAKLAAARPRDTNVNCAISDVSEQRPFFLFEETGTSTLDQAFSNHFIERFARQEVPVVTRTLNEVLDGETAAISFLKIDVEGWESQVIRSLDWTMFRPVVIVVEAVDPFGNPMWSEWDPMLAQQEFEHVYFDGLNRFYLAREHSGLRPAFSTPPNVFDDFVLYREHTARQRLAAQEAAISVAAQTIEEVARKIAPAGDLNAALATHSLPEDKIQTLGNLVLGATTTLLADYSKARDEIDFHVKEALKARIWAGEVEQARALAVAQGIDIATQPEWK